MRASALHSALLVLWVVVSACALNSCARSSDPVIASVDTVPIRLSEVKEQLKGMPCRSASRALPTDSARRSALAMLIRHKVLLVAAEKQGLLDKKASAIHDAKEIYAAEEKLFTFLETTYVPSELDLQRFRQSEKTTALLAGAPLLPVTKANSGDMKKMLFETHFDEWLQEQRSQMPIQVDYAALEGAPLEDTACL